MKVHNVGTIVKKVKVSNKLTDNVIINSGKKYFPFSWESAWFSYHTAEELVRNNVLPNDYDLETHKEFVSIQTGDVTCDICRY